MKIEIKENIENIDTNTNEKFTKNKFNKDNTLALKGIAIIMMLFHHLFRKESLFSGYKVSFFPFNQEFIMEMSTTFKICVSIFAFITGYGLLLSLKKLNSKYQWSSKEISKWIVDRLIKTLSGFWIIAILSYVICQAIDGRIGTVFFKDDILYGIIKMIIDFLGLSKLFGTTRFIGAWWYMSVAILFVFSVPIFVKLFKKCGHIPILIAVIVFPRIIGWKYVNSDYITFLFPLLLGIIFAENNLMVKIANFKVHRNVWISKMIKFVIETAVIVLLYILYTKLPMKLFWEIRYGIIPVCLICYLYEFFLDLAGIKTILKFLGKHSMNIFLVHEFLRANYLANFIYSFRNFLKIGIVLLVCSLVISIILELFKKVIRYDKSINKLQNTIKNRIDETYNRQIDKI